MNITNSLNWLLFISALCVAGHLSKKNAEKFQKVMADTMRYTMGVGLVFSFIQLLALYNIKILDTPFTIGWKLSPLDIMSAISILFFCILIMDSRKKAPGSISSGEHMAEFTNPVK